MFSLLDWSMSQECVINPGQVQSFLLNALVTFEYGVAQISAGTTRTEATRIIAATLGIRAITCEMFLQPVSDVFLQLACCER
jgi:hypothetical protein